MATDVLAGFAFIADEKTVRHRAQFDARMRALTGATAGGRALTQFAD